MHSACCKSSQFTRQRSPRGTQAHAWWHPPAVAERHASTRLVALVVVATDLLSSHELRGVTCFARPVTQRTAHLGYLERSRLLTACAGAKHSKDVQAVSHTAAPPCLSNRPAVPYACTLRALHTKT